MLERVLNGLPDKAEYAESGLEVHFLEICEQFNIPTPVCQLPVRSSGRTFRLDFAWAAKRIFVEIDGSSFHSTPKQIADDGNRQNLLVNAGWTPLRFTYADLRERPAATARTVLRMLH